MPTVQIDKLAGLAHCVFAATGSAEEATTIGAGPTRSLPPNCATLSGFMSARRRTPSLVLVDEKSPTGRSTAGSAIEERSRRGDHAR